MALFLVAAATSPARADCPAAPIADPDDMAISFLAANGVQAASASLHASSVKEGVVVYDEANDVLKLCDGTNWIEVGSGSGSDTLASLSCSVGQIAKFDGTNWVCAAHGGGMNIGFHAEVSSFAVGTTDSAVTGYSELRDDGGGFNPATGVFTAPVAGYYDFSTYAYVTATGSGAFDYYIKTTGAGGGGTGQICRDFTGAATAGNFIRSCSANQYLAAGQTAVVRIKNGTASTAFVRFSGVLIGGGSDTLASLSCATDEIPKWDGTAWACAADGGGGAGTQVAFSAHKNGNNQSIAAGGGVQHVSWSGEHFDTNNNFDTATGRFTPTVAGRYILTVNLPAWTYASCGAYVGVSAGLVKNGSQITSSTIFGNGNIASGSAYISAIVEANGSGDWFGVTINNTCSTAHVLHGATSASVFSGALIGGGGSDTLSTLSCDPGDVPKWNGTAWACAADGGDGGTPGPYLRLSYSTGTLLRGNYIPFSVAEQGGGATWDGTKFTAPIAGVYVITAQTEALGAATHVISILKNSDLLARGYEYVTDTTSKRGGASAATIAHIASGDEIRFHYNHDSAVVPLLQAYGSIAYVGASGGSDTLAGLSCSTNEIPKWNGTAWACAADGGGSATAAGLVAGAIQFNDGSDAFAADDVNLVWDDANKRLGIGTTAPRAGLHVQGVSASGNMLLERYGGSAANFVLSSSNGSIENPAPLSNNDEIGRISFKGYGTSGYVPSGISAGLRSYAREDFTDTAAGNDLRFYTVPLGSTTPAERMRIEPGGNVGIGTTSPSASAKLDVSSTTQGFLPPRMTMMDREAITSPAEGLVVYNTTTKSLDLRVASSWLSFGGSMTGNTMVSGWPDAIRCNDVATDPSTYVLGQSETGNKAWYYRVGVTSSWVAFNNPGGTWNSRAGTEASDCVNQSIAQLYAAGKAFNFVGGATASADGIAGQIQFNEGGNLKADAALHWDNTSKRLGIGTATPDSQLTIASNTFTAANAYSSSTTGNASFVGYRSRGTGASPTIVAADDYFATFLGRAYDGNAYSNSAAMRFAIDGTPGAGSLPSRITFHTSPSGATTLAERMRIVSNGNVGIGTTAPADKLQIEGNPSGGIFLNTTGSGSRQAHIRFGDGGAEKWQWRFNPNDTGDRLLAYSYTLGADVLTLEASGRVGIGTQTPTYKLHVNGGSAANVLLFNHATPYGQSLCRSTPDVNGYYYIGTCSSLTRYKQKIAPLSLSLDTVMRLRPVEFEWKPEQGGQRDLGFLAEEVEAVAPLLGQYDKGQLTGVRYEQMTALLVKAIQELKADNDNLRAELQAANDNDAEQDAAIEALRREIDVLRASR